ncbi:MAG: ribosome biogenesis GTPase YlqF [Clostridia bacterium]|nr:ribosome biogenesis GTPase YlqF [Clostridia bacterium]
MSDTVKVQWFPGHMAKTRRLIGESLPLIDGVVEIVDARIPVSSRNPELDGWLGNKPRMILLNKADVADEQATLRWIRHYAAQDILALPVDCKTGKGLNNFTDVVQRQLGEVLEKYKAKGMVGRTLRLMVVGIPNVGKSSFINRMAGGSKAKVADKPGVTRGNQWFSVGKGIELMDTAGVLWPKFDDPTVGERLAFTGAIKDMVTDVELLAVRLLDIVGMHYASRLEERYKINIPKQADGYELLQLIGKKRGMLISGGEIDTERAAVMVLDEYRGGKWGRITLELPKGE